MSVETGSVPIEVATAPDPQVETAEVPTLTGGVISEVPGRDLVSQLIEKLLKEEDEDKEVRYEKRISHQLIYSNENILR